MDFTKRVSNLLIWFWVTYVVTGLDAVKGAALNASSLVNDSLNAFKESTNNSLISINKSIANLQNYATTSFVSDIEMPAEWFTGQGLARGYDIVANWDNTSKPGRYNIYFGEQDYTAGLTEVDGTDTYSVKKLDGNYISLDGNDEISLVWDGTNILSMKKVERFDPKMNEDLIKETINTYMTANPYQV